MSEKTMLKNKHITIGNKQYRLTIKKEIRYTYGPRSVYVSYLSDVDSQFSINKIFKDVEELEKGLKAWIIQADILNDPETRIFKELEKWDGVINV